MRFLYPILTFFFATASLTAANLSWTPETGYVSDEVELSGLLPEEISKILRWMNDARAAEEKGRYKTALSKYRKVQRKFPKSQYAPEALYRTAQIQLKRNKIDHAFEAFELVSFVYPNYGSFNEIIGEMYKIAVDRKETYRVKIFGVLPGFLNHDRAIKYFERVMSIAPYSDYAPLSLMNVAQIWAIKKNDTLAIYALDRLIINYPKHFLTPDAYLKLGETHETLIRGPFYDQRSTEEAMRYFEDFMIRFPQNRSVDDAEDGLENTQNEMALSKLKIGDFYFYKRNRFHAAEVLYNEAITIAPTSDTADLARNRLTAVAAKRAKFEEENRDKKVPSLEEMQKKAEKRAKRKILGIF